MRLSVLDSCPCAPTSRRPMRWLRRCNSRRRPTASVYTRYWLAEHHNMPAVAATSPPVLIAHLAAQTSHVRLGSGGVMLPNHAPLAVAEQFALLEAAHPGRIDLGIVVPPGPIRSPRWHCVERQAATTVTSRRSRSIFDDVVALMSARGCGCRCRGSDAGELTYSRPRRRRSPSRRCGLLGSSMYSAQSGRRQGLPYVFAPTSRGRAPLMPLRCIAPSSGRVTWRPSRSRS